MLSDNIKKIRKAKGLSQEEFAVKLNVVRQTVSKWENGLSVPDAEMLIRIADELDTDVSVLLDTTIKNCNDSEMTVIAERLESINIQLAKQKETRRKMQRIIFLCIFVISIIFLIRCVVIISFYYNVMNNLSADATIIGGYNGPTNILVLNYSLHLFVMIIAIIFSFVSIFGLHKTRKK